MATTRNMRQDLSHDEVVRRLQYEPDTGNFYWRKSGKPAGSQNRLGYFRICFNCHGYMAHRLAWFYVHGRWPARFIDHKDGDPSNNRLVNLREADDVQNQQNVNWRGYSEKKSHPHRNPFEANINVNGKNVYLDSFPTAEAARAAYLAANLKYFGEFSFHNRESKNA